MTDKPLINPSISFLSQRLINTLNKDDSSANMRELKDKMMLQIKIHNLSYSKLFAYCYNKNYLMPDIVVKRFIFMF